MECEKVIEVYPGVFSYKKCECIECEIKRSATKSFYERFDAAYNEHMGQVEKV